MTISIKSVISSWQRAGSSEERCVGEGLSGIFHRIKTIGMGVKKKLKLLTEVMRKETERNDNRKKGKNEDRQKGKQVEKKKR